MAQAARQSQLAPASYKTPRHQSLQYATLKIQLLTTFPELRTYTTRHHDDLTLRFLFNQFDTPRRLCATHECRIACSVVHHDVSLGWVLPSSDRNTKPQLTKLEAGSKELSIDDDICPLILRRHQPSWPRFFSIYSTAWVTASIASLARRR